MFGSHVQVAEQGISLPKPRAHIDQREGGARMLYRAPQSTQVEDEKVRPDIARNVAGPVFYTMHAAYRNHLH